jgi:hypothetical protein
MLDYLADFHQPTYNLNLSPMAQDKLISTIDPLFLQTHQLPVAIPQPKQD